MVRRQTLALAMALDRARSARICGLFVFELAHLGRPVRVPKIAEGTFPHAFFLALERHRRFVSQSTADTERGGDRGHAGADFHRARLCLRYLKLDAIASDLRYLDYRKLAAPSVRLVHRKYAALYPDNVSHLFPVRIPQRKPHVENGDHNVVTFVLRSL